MRKTISADDLQCYGDLARHYIEGIDYAVNVMSRERSEVAVLAPHGGRIEGRTSDVARLIAGDEHSLYLFEGLRTGGDNFHCLHLSSHRFDEPRALDLISRCGTVLAVHGYASPGPDVLLGGLNERLKRAIAHALAEAGLSCLTEGHRFPGSHPLNICNRGRSGAGVQLELSEEFRKSGDWPAFAQAMHAVLGSLDHTEPDDRCSQYQQWKRQSVKRSAVDRSNESGVEVDDCTVAPLNPRV
jgi:phage replication-related protein YjqB (UPF0714/DUF867 family)